MDLAWTGEVLEKEVEILVNAENCAPSAVKGVVVSGALEATDLENVPVIEMAANRAMINPESTELPAFTFRFEDAEGNPIDPTNIATDVTVIVEINDDNDWEYFDALYIGLGYVPWAGGRDAATFGATSLEYTYSLEGKSGEILLHIVAYNHNRARMDQIVTLNFQPPETPVIAERFAPTGVWIYSLTKDSPIEFYGLKETAGSKLASKELHLDELNGAPVEGNIFVQIAWDAPATSTDIVGYNIYRSDDGGLTYKKVAFRTGDYGFDHGIGIEPGKEYFYKVRSVYSDGSESGDSNVVRMVPLDIFKVKLVSPANRATNVSRRPIFRWIPTDKEDPTKAPVLGGGLIDENDIYYGYYLWIYDTTQSDGQHIVPDDEFYTFGPSEVSVQFLDPSYDWYYFVMGDWYYYFFDGLEAYKTYEWGLDYAYAIYYGDDEDGDGFEDWISLAVTIDWGYGIDRWVNEPDYYNRFTTGEGY
ncbi:fibronectin type III domain-containing protein [Kosmotoga pacifica]|uniref:fibronectin type III domain-containing protein n=1 Tax=Kosmotoga pacifica TaxID=1330330 RepID=UPI0014703FAD|nr:fibronectin type III domain-containing protein [Kosmotoga pacifica]